MAEKPDNQELADRIERLEGELAELRSMEKELRASEERYHSVLEAAPDPITVYDPEGLVTYVNPAFEEVFGWSLDEVKGRRLDFVPEHETQKTMAALKRTLSGEKMFIESQRLTKQGHLLDVQLKSTTFFNGKGELAGLIVISRDITERKRARQALKESEERHRRVIETNPEPMVVYDMEGHVTYFNPAFTRVFGWTLDECLGRKMTQFVPEQCWPETNTMIASVRECKRFMNVETLRYNRNGDLIQVSISGANYVDQDGRPVGSVITLKDITEQKRAEEALKKANEDAVAASRAKSEFVARMSHEIRTPMNAILGMAEILAETELTADQKNYLSILQTSGELLLATINNILDFSKIEAGQIELESIPFDLYDLVESVGMILSGRAAGKGVELACRVAPEVPFYLMGDPVRLKQVLVNLVDNAIKFTEEGEVALEITREPEDDAGDEIRITVKDTGIGIDPEHHDTIFDSFTQIDTSTTRNYSGTGLGLAICKRLVERMSGRIGVDSRPGRGTCVTLSLNLPRTNLAAKANLGPEPAVPDELQGLRVLVVDDNATNRMVAMDHLSRWGMRPFPAEGGRRALHTLLTWQAEGDPCRLMILDIHMPGMDGFEVVDRLNSLKMESPPEVLILGSSDIPEFRKEAEKLGISGFQVKPLKRDALLLEIKRVMGMEPQPPDRHETDVRVTGEHLPPLRILLAEDTEPNRLMIHKFLRKSRVSIIDATNGLEALELFKTCGFDVVLMDIEMPVMDGLEATRRIREWEGSECRRPTPIAALTAHAFTDKENECMDAGCDEFIKKPVRKTELIELLERLKGQSTCEAGEITGNPKAIHPPSTDQPVCIDKELEDLIPDLLAYIRESLATMDTALSGEDFTELHRLSHGLKGAVRNYGFDDLGNMFFSMEKASDSKLAEEIGRRLRLLREYLDRLEIEYV